MKVRMSKFERAVLQRKQSLSAGRLPSAFLMVLNSAAYKRTPRSPISAVHTLASPKPAELSQCCTLYKPAVLPFTATPFSSPAPLAIFIFSATVSIHNMSSPSHDTQSKCAPSPPLHMFTVGTLALVRASSTPPALATEVRKPTLDKLPGCKL